MVGLLDFLQTPQAQGLAIGLLNSSGYSTTPVTFGQALGQGLASANQLGQRDFIQKLNEAKLLLQAQKGSGAKSALGKLQEDFNSGIINKATYDAGIVKATTMFDQLGRVIQNSPISQPQNNLAPQTQPVSNQSIQGDPYALYNLPNSNDPIDVDNLPVRDISTLNPLTFNNPVEEEAYYKQEGINKQAETQQVKISPKIANLAERARVIANKLGSAGNPLQSSEGISIGGATVLPGGQQFGRMAETENQRYRDELNAIRTQLGGFLKPMIRRPGEGTWTDKDQQILERMLPRVDVNSETNNAIIDNILKTYAPNYYTEKPQVTNQRKFKKFNLPN